MRLHLSPEDQAFREEMRTFFTTQVPQSVRDAVAARHELTKDQIVEAQREEITQMEGILDRYASGG